MPLETASSVGYIDLKNKDCNKCNLCQGRSAVVNGFGNFESKILFVTDSVGGYEESALQPLQGDNGELFNSLLKRAGLSRKNIFVTSVIRCKNAPKKPKELQVSIDACKDYLDQEIATIKPNVIVPLGGTALKVILQSKLLNITEERGVLHWSEKYQCKVIPIFHPNYLYNVPQHENVTIIDLIRIKSESRSPVPIPTPRVKTKVILTIEEFRAFKQEYKSAELLAVDIEATGLDWMKDHVIGMSFSKSKTEGYYIPLIVGGGACNLQTKTLEKIWGDDYSEIIEGLKELLEGSAQKILHNGSYDLKMLLSDLKIEVNNFCWDTLLMDHLLYENAQGLHGLENCALRFTDFGSYKRSTIAFFKDFKIPKKKRDYSLLPLQLIGPYGCLDTIVAFSIFETLYKQLQDNDLLRLYKQVVLPIQKVLIKTEMRGVGIDKEYLTHLGKKYETDISETEQQIYKLVGTFKINSNKELPNLLYNKLKLPKINRTKSGNWSTDKKTLEELADKHPVISLIQKYKMLEKVKGTFIEGILAKLDSNDRLHTSYLVWGTVSGRLSSRGPNLQQIPSKILDIQQAFIAGSGRVFIASDLKQAEWRAWANFSQDPQMVNDCNQDPRLFDIHKEVASISYHIPVEKVTKLLRDLAKRLVFGVLYGLSAKSAAEQLKCPIEDAYTILNYIKQRYPYGFNWIENLKKIILNHGIVRTHFGRIRHLQPMLDSVNKELQSKALRQGVNSVIQGTIGDLNNIATIRILNKFEKENIDGYLALTIHDALIFSVLESQQAQAVKIIEEEMTRPVENWNIPMFVDVKVGSRWGEVHKVEDEELPLPDLEDQIDEEDESELEEQEV
jgi:DNA polymerase I